jgi:hypothetical protein
MVPPFVRQPLVCNVSLRGQNYQSNRDNQPEYCDSGHESILSILDAKLILRFPHYLTSILAPKARGPTADWISPSEAW